MIERREFGYFTFGQKIMIRHISLRSPSELFELIKKVTPLHMYYSAAHYQYPQAPMEEKVWLGAELIFDIDADHLNLPCKEKHDFSVCEDCRSMLPPTSERCSNCGSMNVRRTDWVCESCIEAAKEETHKLLDFLEMDFGIPYSKISVNFSGNRGFHTVVNDEKLFTLDQMSRKEITDYILGNGLDPTLYGIPTDRRRYPSATFEYTDGSWRGRLARAAFEVIRDLHKPRIAENMIKLIGNKEYGRLLQIKDSLLMSWLDSPKWEALKPSVIKAITTLAVEEARSEIDTIVTTDIHRLLRLANTLNGKTGFLAKKLEPDALERFNPFVDAVVMPDEPCRVHVIYMPKTRIRDEWYGPYNNEDVKIPACLAVLLLCKGVASLK
ncbi:MAG: DNA primase small subunit domain-containing protein [Nitrososphaerota archaeon]